MTTRNRDVDEREDGGIRTERTITVPVDVAIDLVANRRRRDVLAHLRDARERTATVEEVVSVLVQQADDRTGVPPDRDRVASALHHRHLPKLADEGVIEYDRGEGTVRYRPSPLLEDLLDRIHAAEQPR